MDEMLTRKEVAALLKVSKNTVFDLLRKGELPARKVGGQWRVRREDLLEYMKGAVRCGSSSR